MEKKLESAGGEGKRERERQTDIATETKRHRDAGGRK